MKCVKKILSATLVCAMMAAVLCSSAFAATIQPRAGSQAGTIVVNNKEYSCQATTSGDKNGCWITTYCQASCIRKATCTAIFNTSSHGYITEHGSGYTPSVSGTKTLAHTTPSYSDTIALQAVSGTVTIYGAGDGARNFNANL